MNEGMLVRAMGAVSSLDDTLRRELQERGTTRDPAIRDRTASIIADVRRDGDVALRALALQFDGVNLETLEVSRVACRRALDALAPALRVALERAVRNIDAVHRAFLPTAVEVSPEPGIVIGRRPDPLARVGVYAPGGRAAYPSSLLMGAIPARVAGVGEVIVCSPPGPDGLPSGVVLAAAALANVDRVFAIGGAGAIAAMALGTQTVPRVERIVGPGNVYVAEAKLQLVGDVTIDAPAGPSELLVIADDSASPEGMAREMIAQAEHDPEAAVMALVYGERADAWIASVHEALARLLAVTVRGDIVRVALATRGALLTAAGEDEAIAFANTWSAEHVLLAVHDDRQEYVLERLRAAGTVFLGASSSVAFGDYMTGANHVLPTGGLARCYSGLSTVDFMRWTTWQRVSPLAATALAADVACLAHAEGLPGHASAAGAWLPAVSAPDRLQVARAAYDEVPLYDPMRSEVALDLTDNTNLWGLPPSAERVMRDVHASAITRYPTLYAPELKRELATYLGVTPEMIVTGCGSDDILDSALRAFGEPGDLVVSADPSFGMVPIFARMNALAWRGVPELPSHQPDIEAMLASRARILYLCSPNNPTGVLVARDSIERAISESDGVIMVDEAYAEFAGITAMSLVQHSDRVLIVRTMSKAFGLAGLRIGYAVGQPALVREVEKSRGPYKLSALGERMAVAALRNDLPWVREHAQLAVDIRERLAARLRDMGLMPLPSHANFVCVPVDDCTAVSRALRARGVAARPFPKLPHLGDALRVSVGPWPLMERFLDALQGALETSPADDGARIDDGVPT